MALKKIKPILFLITISSFLTYSCAQIKSDKNFDMKEFKCLFIGNNADISNFLGIDNINNNDDIRLQVFANQYMFLKENESLKIYDFNKNTDVLETFKLKEISTQLKTDRKYKMQITDSTSSGFKLTITSIDKTFTQMKDKYIIVECVRKK